MGEITEKMTFGADRESDAAIALRMKCTDDLSATVFKSVINEYIRSEVGNWNMVDFFQGSIPKCEDGKLEQMGRDLTAQVIAILTGSAGNAREETKLISEDVQMKIEGTVLNAIVKNFRMMKEALLEELDVKLHSVMKSVRSEFEDAMVSRCKEALATYEAKLNQLDLEKDRLKCCLNLAESNYYRLDFVNRNQTDRLVAMARTECGLKARIAALEERADENSIQRRTDSDSTILKLQSSLIKKNDENEQLKKANNRKDKDLEEIGEEIEKLKVLLEKVEKRPPTYSLDSNGNQSLALDTDTEDETDQPPRKRSRQEFGIGSLANISVAVCSFLDPHRSLSEASRKLRSACSAIKETTDGVVNRLDESCVIV